MAKRIYRNDVSPALAIKPFRDMLVFGGRSTRTEVVSFWLLGITFRFVCQLLWLVIWPLSAGLADRVLDIGETIGIIFVLPYFALVARRMHDHDHPAWPGVALLAAMAAGNFYFGIAPHPEGNIAAGFLLGAALIGSALLLLAFFWQPTPDANRYGPDPRLEAE